MSFQISQEALECQSISLQIVPLSEIADVSLTADACRPCFWCPHDGIVEPDREEYLTALLTLALGAPPDPKMFTLARDVGVPIVTHVRNVLPQRNDGEKLLARVNVR